MLKRKNVSPGRRYDATPTHASSRLVHMRRNAMQCNATHCTFRCYCQGEFNFKRIILQVHSLTDDPIASVIWPHQMIDCVSRCQYLIFNARERATFSGDSSSGEFFMFWGTRGGGGGGGGYSDEIIKRCRLSFIGSASPPILKIIFKNSDAIKAAEIKTFSYLKVSWLAMIVTVRRVCRDQCGAKECGPTLT